MHRTAADIVRARLDALGYSQRQLGERLGHVGAGMVSRILTGDRPVPMADIDHWADAMQLHGEDRLMWRRAALLTSCPPEVADMLSGADMKIGQLTTLVAGMLARECPSAGPEEISSLLGLLGQPEFQSELQDFLLRHLGRGPAPKGRRAGSEGNT
jgi:transcriptional regulator with XRE-family HTH domain